MSIYNWLSEKLPAGYKPQMCWAGANKQALLWLPGNTFKGSDFVKWAIGKAQFVGCTQLAFESYTQPQQIQQALIFWVGLDIDELPIDDSKLIEVCKQFGGSLRSSCGGSGRHLIFRLDQPISCTYQQANRIVKLLTKPIVEAVERAGMAVCKADKRAFYLEGGKNEWIMKQEAFYETQGVEEAIRADDERREAEADVGGDGADGIRSGFDGGVEHWLRQFRSAGLIRDVGPRNPVNISRFVKILRLAGEPVHTKSPLTSTSGVNGYLDVGPDWIQLWTWADGGPVWRWDA